MPVLAGSRSCWKGEMLEIRKQRSLRRVSEGTHERNDLRRGAAFMEKAGSHTRTATVATGLGVPGVRVPSDAGTNG